MSNYFLWDTEYFWTSSRISNLVTGPVAMGNKNCLWATRSPVQGCPKGNIKSSIFHRFWLIWYLKCNEDNSHLRDGNMSRVIKSWLKLQYFPKCCWSWANTMPADIMVGSLCNQAISRYITNSCTCIGISYSCLSRWKMTLVHTSSGLRSKKNYNAYHTVECLCHCIYLIIYNQHSRVYSSY